jgi:hypothetical protein
MSRKLSPAKMRRLKNVNKTHRKNRERREERAKYEAALGGLRRCGVRGDTETRGSLIPSESEPSPPRVAPRQVPLRWWEKFVPFGRRVTRSG